MPMYCNLLWFKCNRVWPNNRQVNETEVRQSMNNNKTKYSVKGKKYTHMYMYGTW